MFPAAHAFFTAGILLLALLIGQALMHPATRAKALFREPADFSDQPAWIRSGCVFWGTGLLRAGTPNMAMLLVGTMLPDDGGAFFAALRLAMVVNLILVASNMLAMPMLSAAHERSDTHAIRTISGFITLVTTLPACVFLVAFIWAGDWALGLYSDAFSFAKWAVVLIAAGYVVKVAFGPGSALLQMMGHEAQFLRLTLWVSGFMLALLAPLIWAFGLYGAALAVGLELALTGALAWWMSRRLLGIDPSIFGMLNPQGAQK